MISIGTGLALAALGLVLWLTTRGVHTPVVTLTKVGVVLMALGALEVVISTVALALPSTRHKGEFGSDR